MKFIILAFCLWLGIKKEKLIFSQINEITYGFFPKIISSIKNIFKDLILFFINYKKITVDIVPLWTLITVFSLLFAPNILKNIPETPKFEYYSVMAYLLVANYMIYLSSTLILAFSEFNKQRG